MTLAITKQVINIGPKRNGCFALEFVGAMLILNHLYGKLRQFLFLTKRGNFVLKLAAVFTPSTKEPHSARCVTTHSLVMEWEVVGVGLELGQ